MMWFRPPTGARHLRTEPRPSRSRPAGLAAAGLLLLLVPPLVGSIGCNDDARLGREIQQRRQLQQQAQTQVDHLGDAFDYIQRLPELSPEAAGRQITYHLNSHLEKSGRASSWQPPQLLETLRADLRDAPPLQRLGSPRLEPNDLDHLRLTYLLSRVASWAGEEPITDPLWQPWLEEHAREIGVDQAARLQQAVRLFDWTVRNIRLEPLEAPEDAPPGLNLPAGMRFEGAGYRQTPLQTLWRGSGDALQRARIFLQLCHQADLPACVLGLPATDAAEPTEWLCGVRIGPSLYLFEPRLGLPVPGPGQEGIATLQDARRDAAVLRRLNVPGWFDYPIDRSQIQQSIALIDAPPAALGRRMADLEQTLVGESRMRLAVDADALAAQMAELPGVSLGRLWQVSVLAEMYDRAMETAAQRNPLLLAYRQTMWGMLEGDLPLARARWRHLQGQFDPEDDVPGARVMYMELRRPEFEIADLRFNLELQNQYGVRRPLGQDTATYDRQIQHFQAIIRQAKQTATYWLSLIHYDDGRFDTAENWLTKRVLGETRDGRWDDAARYNLARAVEHLGESDRAIELYRTIGDTQEHGNRLRARLLSRVSGEADATDTELLSGNQGD